MNRSQLEHIIRASSAITLEREFIVIGSQSVLGAHPDAPPALVRSMDLDLYPKDRPDASIVIDGAIGEGSTFHQTFGYYAHGVGPETAVLPAGWSDRLVPVSNENTDGATAWCLDPADLAVSKLVAGRDTDRDFVGAMVTHGLIDRTTVIDRLQATALPASRKKQITAFLEALENRSPRR
jgi:hypothetical protein